YFFFQAEDGIRDRNVTGVQTCALPISCDAIQWKPEWGKERMISMITERSDWCISRQRVWGVPIPIFYCDDCGADIVTPETIANEIGRASRRERRTTGDGAGGPTA